MKIKGVKPSKIGNSWFFRIPKAYVDNDIVSTKNQYCLEIFEDFQ